MGVQVGQACVADEQCVAGEHQPRLVGAGVVGDGVSVMGSGMARRGQRPNRSAAEYDNSAVTEGHVLKRTPAPSGRYAVAPVRATSSGSPDTSSAACTWVSKTATIGMPSAWARRR